MGIADWGQKESAAGIAFRTHFFLSWVCLPHFFFCLISLLQAKKPDLSRVNKPPRKRKGAVQLPSFCRSRRPASFVRSPRSGFYFSAGGAFLPFFFACRACRVATQRWVEHRRLRWMRWPQTEKGRFRCHFGGNRICGWGLGWVWLDSVALPLPPLAVCWWCALPCLYSYCST